MAARIKPFYSMNRQIARDRLVVKACPNTSVVQADNDAIAFAIICEIEACKIGAPFGIDFICFEVMFKQVLKNSMSLAFSVVWIFTPHYSQQSKFHIHISMNRSVAEIKTLSAQGKYEYCRSPRFR